MAVLEGKTLSERVRGDLVVKDAAGEVTDHAKNFTLMQLPYFTPRHTFVVDGTEYSVSNQLRTKPGAYVRRRGNEELEATFNLAKGANFRVLMEPEKGLLYMQPSHTTSKIPLHPILSALGIPAPGHRQQLGLGCRADEPRGVQESRQARRQAVRDTHPSGEANRRDAEERARVLREYFDETKMDPEVSMHTLGLSVREGDGHGDPRRVSQAPRCAPAAADVDDRDSLAFKTFHSVDDFVKERILLDARAMRTKLGWKLDASKGDLKRRFRRDRSRARCMASSRELAVVGADADQPDGAYRRSVARHHARRGRHRVRARDPDRGARRASDAPRHPRPARSARVVQDRRRLPSDNRCAA
jgi:DNA-directed RNA polymerase beta subunit